MRRRTLMGGTLGALAAPALVERVGAQSAFDWRRFRGQNIEVSLTLGPRAQQLMAHTNEFQELTGMRVGVEAVPEQQHRQKLVIEFTAGRPSFDVITISLHVSKRQMGKAGWLADMRPLLADAQLTAPDYDFSDFGAGGVRFVTQSDGRIDTLPLNIDYWVLFWNKEIFQRRGVEYPRTMEEIVTAAERLTDRAAGTFGFVARGLRNANVPVWTSFLLGQGKETVENGALTTDGPEAIWAGELYKRLMANFAPPGSVGFNWNECQTQFSQGRAAMWLDGIGFAPPLEDPQRSRIAGKVGYGVVPAGPRARHSAMFGDGIGIAERSQKRGPAYLYCQWATNKLNQLRLLQTGSGAPPRTSPYRDPSVMASGRFPREWFDAMLQSAEIARPGLPEIIPVTEFRDTIGIALTNTIGGADVATELRRATEAFRPVLEASERA